MLHSNLNLVIPDCGLANPVYTWKWDVPAGDLVYILLLEIYWFTLNKESTLLIPSPWSVRKKSRMSEWYILLELYYIIRVNIWWSRYIGISSLIVLFAIWLKVTHISNYNYTCSMKNVQFWYFIMDIMMSRPVYFRYMCFVISISSTVTISCAHWHFTTNFYNSAS